MTRIQKFTSFIVGLVFLAVPIVGWKFLGMDGRIAFFLGLFTWSIGLYLLDKGLGTNIVGNE